MSNLTMRQLLEAGVHFGHRTRFWNPKMAPFIFGHRSKIHIINLEQTLPMMREAHDYISRLAASGGKVLFVGTKRAARDVMEAEAKRCGMPYVNQRWLGGTLTNFPTVKRSIKRMLELAAVVDDGSINRLNKKEQLTVTRDLTKLRKSLGGISDMQSLPDALFIVDVGYEEIAVREANKLGIPVIAIVDTNCAPEGITYPIPGNDDATRAIRLYAQMAADAVIAGRGVVTTGKSKNEFVELEGDKPQAPAARVTTKARKPVEQAEPAAAEPATAEPATAEPVAAEPAAAEPAAAKPAADVAAADSVDTDSKEA